MGFHYNTKGYDEDQPRDESGKWSSGGKASGEAVKRSETARKNNMPYADHGKQAKEAFRLTKLADHASRISTKWDSDKDTNDTVRSHLGASKAHMASAKQSLGGKTRGLHQQAASAHSAAASLHKRGKR